MLQKHRPFFTTLFCDICYLLFSLSSSTQDLSVSMNGFLFFRAWALFFEGYGEGGG